MAKKQSIPTAGPSKIDYCPDCMANTVQFLLVNGVWFCSDRQHDIDVMPYF
jgi:hypothetical protein